MDYIRIVGDNYLRHLDMIDYKVRNLVVLIEYSRETNTCPYMGNITEPNEYYINKLEVELNEVLEFLKMNVEDV